MFDLDCICYSKSLSNGKVRRTVWKWTIECFSMQAWEDIGRDRQIKQTEQKTRQKALRITTIISKFACTQSLYSESSIFSKLHHRHRLKARKSSHRALCNYFNFLFWGLDIHPSSLTSRTALYKIPGSFFALFSPYFFRTFGNYCRTDHFTSAKMKQTLTLDLTQSGSSASNSILLIPGRISGHTQTAAIAKLVTKTWLTLQYARNLSSSEAIRFCLAPCLQDFGHPEVAISWGFFCKPLNYLAELSNKNPFSMQHKHYPSIKDVLDQCNLYARLLSPNAICLLPKFIFAYPSFLFYFVTKRDQEIFTIVLSIVIIGESMNHTGESMNHTGESMNHTGESMNHTGESMNHTGESMNHTGESMNHTGESMNHTGEPEDRALQGNHLLTISQLF